MQGNLIYEKRGEYGLFASSKNWWWMLVVAILHTFAAEAVATDVGFQAKMKTSVAGHSSQAKIMTKGAKFRMTVIGGRTFSTMIAHYDEKILWLMAPAVKQYTVQPLSAMGRKVPHFFHPDVNITKKKIAEETVDGIKAIKYEAQITMPGVKRPYDGHLWEALNLPGYPLKWVDPEYQVTVEWKDVEVAPLENSLFELPAGYALIPGRREAKK